MGPLTHEAAVKKQLIKTFSNSTTIKDAAIQLFGHINYGSKPVEVFCQIQYLKKLKYINLGLSEPWISELSGFNNEPTFVASFIKCASSSTTVN